MEGPALKEGRNVVIIDDVATTGKAFVESIEVLQKMNIKIKKAICIIDRGEGARETADSDPKRITKTLHQPSGEGPGSSHWHLLADHGADRHLETVDGARHP